MKTIKISLLASIFSIVSLTGCAVHVAPGKGSSAISSASQESLEKDFPFGKTSYKDVLLKLGPPSQKTKEAGYDIWQYKYSREASVGILFVSAPISSSKTATFYFSEQTGLLDKIAFSNES